MDGADSAEVKDKATGDLEIDPVMQQYMAMVQQQKEKEDEVKSGIKNISQRPLQIQSV